MKPINCSYIYNLALNIDQLSLITVGEVPLSQLATPYLALKNLIDQDLLILGIAKEKAQILVDILDSLEATESEVRSYRISHEEIRKINNARYEFETVLKPDLDQQAVFAVSPKRAYDIRSLIWTGESVFDPSLIRKVPETQDDVVAACRCIAFELPTAAVFHLFRAMEAVILAYIKALTGMTPEKPSDRTLGAMFGLLKDEKTCDPKVLASLRDLKDLHRNPALHPEESVETIDEAIAVLNAVQAPITYMLKKIPEPND
jgi:hypothetical protein